MELIARGTRLRSQIEKLCRNTHDAHESNAAVKNDTETMSKANWKPRTAAQITTATTNECTRLVLSMTFRFFFFSLFRNNRNGLGSGDSSGGGGNDHTQKEIEPKIKNKRILLKIATQLVGRVTLITCRCKMHRVETKIQNLNLKNEKNHLEYSRQSSPHNSETGEDRKKNMFFSF